jgi:hypothetical protein
VAIAYASRNRYPLSHSLIHALSQAPTLLRDSRPPPSPNDDPNLPSHAKHQPPRFRRSALLHMQRTPVGPIPFE